MGCCPSSEQDPEQNVAKVILLGAAGSGKSTFFKQLQLQFGGGYNEAQRKDFKVKIYEQVVSNIRLLLNKCSEYMKKDPTTYANLEFGDDASELAEEFGQLAITEPITSDLAAKIQTFWSDQGVQNAFNMRAKFCITDSTDYFVRKLDKIVQDSYVPNNEDLVFTRFATGGMEQADFTISGTVMRIIDVGGQRKERRKWALYPDDTIRAAIFVTSLSAFDETLIEDMRTNVMVESFEVFKAAWGADWAAKLNFILFLNKEDLFRAKMSKLQEMSEEEKKEKEPIGFKEAWGDEFTEDPCDIMGALDFIKAKYASVVEGDPDDPGTKQVYMHVTTATDADNVRNVFNDVQHIIINASLSRNFLD